MSPDEPPAHAVIAAGFAERLAQRYAGKEVSVTDLFAAFAGLVSVMDRQIAASCLEALDQRLSGVASSPRI